MWSDTVLEQVADPTKDHPADTLRQAYMSSNTFHERRPALGEEYRRRLLSGPDQRS